MVPRTGTTAWQYRPRLPSLRWTGDRISPPRCSFRRVAIAHINQYYPWRRDDGLREAVRGVVRGTKGATRRVTHIDYRERRLHNRLEQRESLRSRLVSLGAPACAALEALATHS